MNKLFSLLLRGNNAETGWYYKKTAFIPMTQKALSIVNIMMADVPISRASMYAAALCQVALNTQYGAEIKKLDPNNTYAPVVRPPACAHSDPEYCAHDLIKPLDAYKDLLLFLQEDIADTLDTNSWFDMIGAGCLQLLREVN